MAVHSGRIAWIDRARAFGAVAIVLLHVFVSSNNAFELDLGHQLAYAAISITLARWAVPAFFMLSGYLLLQVDREVAWDKALLRARRMLITLLTFGYAFALIEEFVVGRSSGTLGPQILVSAAIDVLSGNTWDHLWYVYAQLVVYLAEPLILHFRKRFQERVFIVLCVCLFLAVLVVPTIMRLEVPNAAIALTCFCLGGLLDYLRLSVPVAVLGLGSLVTMLVVSLSSVVAGTGDAGYIFLQGSFLAAGYAVFILAALRRMTPPDARQNKVLSELSRESFGIYVIHPFFIHLLLMVVGPALIPSPVFELLVSGAVLGLTWCAVKLCRHIPVVRDVL